MSINKPETPDEHSVATLRTPLAELTSAYESGDVLRTLGRANYMQDVSLGLVNGRHAR